MTRILLLCLFLLAVLTLGGCRDQGETGLAGSLMVDGRPVAGAQVEIYLKGEKDRATSPFAATATDGEGRFRLLVPPGRYFLVARKKETADDGRVRMLMADCPANPLEVTDGMREVAGFSLREMGRDGALVPDPGTGVTGRVTAGGEGVGEAYVYVYTDQSSDLMGPSYGEAVRTGADGTFRIDLPAGRYFLAARRRSDGGRTGGVAEGDLNGRYPGNPVVLARGELKPLGDFPLRLVDAEARRERLDQGTFTPTGTSFTGRAVTPAGAPVAGIYLFAYLDARMVGKPSYISAPSGEDGTFTLFVGEGGIYYLGARSTFGGPLEPGERVGTFDGRPDHGAPVGRGESVALGDVVVREVW